MTDTPTRSTAVSPDTSDGFHTFRELYQHRHSLFLLLLRWCPSQAQPWWSRQHHPGGEPMFPGYVIAGLETPHGPISYHLPEDWANILIAAGVTELPAAPPWDGHTSDDVIERLQETAIGSLCREEPRQGRQPSPEDQAKLDAMQAAMEQLAEAIGGPVPEGAKAMTLALGWGVPTLGEQLEKNGRTLPDADDWEARHQAWNLLRITDMLTEDEAGAIGARLVREAIRATGGEGVVFHGGTIRLPRGSKEVEA